ncbi:MAG TPA: CoA transferase [Myxococcota bacterium]|nr:CoA transferase [Myxococcota bacterium]
MQVLDGIRVLDLSQFLSGPRASQLLAMFGAEVLKIEPPAGDSMRMLLTLSGSERTMSCLHQNKKSLVIDLNSPAGREVFLQLVDVSDVLIENLTPGSMDKLELSWDLLRRRNPRLIYACISGFGRSGPLSNRTAFDIISQATGGTMYGNGIPDRPPGVFFGDLCSGESCAFGILLALMAREKTGSGQLIDISMQDVMYFHNFWGFSEKATRPVKDEIVSIFGRDVTRLLTDYEHPMAFWNSYRASDGYVAVVALSDRQWNRLMEVIGRADLIGDPRFDDFISRVRNADEARPIIAKWMGRHSQAQIIEALSEKRIPCGKVQDYEQLNNDPQLDARGMYRTVNHPRLGEIDVPGIPVKLSATPGEICKPCPDLGQDTAEALSRVLGLTEEQVAELVKDGVVL